MGYYTTQNRKRYSLDPPPGLRPSRGNALTFVQLGDGREPKITGVSDWVIME